MTTKSRKPAALTAAERKLLRKLLAKSEASAEPRVEVPRVAAGRKIKNTSRAFWTDGTNAHLRRKRANPAMVERVDAKVKAGEYRHVRTSDDVEIYEIAEWSSLRRKKLDISQMPITRVEACIVRSACKGDWALYYDAVSEYAHRYKHGSLPSNTAEMMLQQQMRYLELRIMRRGGPTPMMIHNELSKVRKARTGTQIFLPH